MIVEFSVVDTKDFTIEHLFDSPENQDLIANFQATNDAAVLEDYLKIQSVEDEENNCSRTYLVKDALSGELVCFTDCAKDVGLPPSGTSGKVRATSC